jgi:hypothetical protein
MRTPAGTECDLYYEDFHRGRDAQECRAHKSEKSAYWQPKDCAKCPVPEILRANSSPHLQLEITINRGFMSLGNNVKVRAWCNRHDIEIENPYTGCSKCNADRPGLNLFAEALEELDGDDD